MLNLKSVIVLVLLYVSLGAKLPEFFNLCKKNAVDFNKCIENNAKIALPHLLKGVKELDIPPLTNLKVPEISAPSYVPYDFNFNGNISSLEGVSFTDPEFDMNALAVRAKLIFPNLELRGKYKINGFVGKIPITGNGWANVTIHNLTLGTVFTFNLFHHHGADYFQIVSALLMSYNVNSINYHFENLFDGNAIQGKLGNQILNKYWWILAGDILPPVSLYLVEMTYKVGSQIHANTTFDDVFPPF